MGKTGIGIMISKSTNSYGRDIQDKLPNTLLVKVIHELLIYKCSIKRNAGGMNERIN